MLAHGFLGVPGDQACLGMKIDQGILGRLWIGQGWVGGVDEAIWAVKRVKKCERAIFEPNKRVLAHNFLGVPESRCALGQKSIGGSQLYYRLARGGLAMSVGSFG